MASKGLLVWLELVAMCLWIGSPLWLQGEDPWGLHRMSNGIACVTVA